ncbi:MAG: hypothetical protein KDB26_11775, partial [Microthrixaceae bacterium]|nr:hypothetical protein [Microthrixaceae bacterium]
MTGSSKWSPSTDPGVGSRRIAGEVLVRVDVDGAYSNLALRHALDSAGLETADAKLVTDLVYGTLRMRRSVDYLIGRFLVTDPPPTARAFLRLGAYQLVFRPDIPAYAAVSATVSAAPKRFRPLCNAVLRKITKAPVKYPSIGDELSYPDWIIEVLVDDLGRERGLEALREMNSPAAQIRREDGYTQDKASQLVAEAIGAQPGDVVADLCAAPGGKSTGIAASGAFVVASDSSPTRTGLLAKNAARYGNERVGVYCADALKPALKPGSADKVLLDAPCSGLGVLRRRPDARWRLEPEAPARLAEIQKEMISAAVGLLKPDGELIYSVCTLTAVETIGVDEFVQRELPQLEPIEAPGGP